MFLDQRTLAVVLATVLLLQGIGWLLIWRSQPRTAGVRTACIAALMFVPGLLLVSQRGQVNPWISEVLANYFSVGGLLLTLLALAQMVERPLPLRAGLVLYGVNLVMWPAYVLLVPGHPGWIALLGAVPGLGYALLCAREAWAARQVPQVIRGLVTALNLIHAAVAALRLLDGAQHVLTGRGVLPASASNIFYLEFILYAAFFFIGIIALLGSRLAYAQVQQNEMLLREADQRQKLQAELAAALAEESAARREQRHFLDMVGHEFRTPLAIIDRAAEMVAISLEGREAAPYQAALREVADLRSEGQRLRLMIDAFLAQERLQSGLGDARREVVDLVALLQDLHNRLDPCQRARVDLQLAPACLVRGDPDLLRIALACLLDAALPAPGAEVSGAEAAGTDAAGIVLRLEPRPGRAELTLLGSAWRQTVAADDDTLGRATARRLLEAQGGALLLGALPGRLALLRLPLAEAVGMVAP